MMTDRVEPRPLTLAEIRREQWITPEEVARLRGVTLDEVHRKIDRRQLRCANISRSIKRLKPEWTKEVVWRTKVAREPQVYREPKAPKPRVVRVKAVRPEPSVTTVVCRPLPKPPGLSLRDHPDGWIYFIQTADGRYVKIGYANRVYRRMLELQSAHPEPLRLIAQIPDCDEFCEGYWHRKHAGDRAVGEWFRLTQELRADIERAIDACRDAVPCQGFL